MTAVVSKPSASSDPSPVRYHVVDAHNNHVQVAQLPNVRTAAGASVAYITITNGGDKITLSQTNAADLATALSNFGSNGVLS